MIINPYAYTAKDEDIDEILREERITEIIDKLLKRKPGIILENTDPFTLIPDIQDIIAQLGYTNVTPKHIIQNLFQYGPFQDLIEDPEVTDIFINAPDFVAVRKKGKDTKLSINFKSNKELKEFVKRIVIMNGGRINENEAKVITTDPRYNLRIVATLESISIHSPMLHIRKPPTYKTLTDLIEDGMLTQQQAQQLAALVKERKSIVISGPPSSGKTTLLAALIREIPEHERYAIIQETFEIPRIHPNSFVEVMRTSELQPWLKQYTLFELVKIGLLETLGRVIIGEVKGAETYEWVFAVYSGMNGSMTTVHTNSSQETIPKLLMLMKMANTDLPADFLESVLLSSIDYILYVKGFKLREIYNVKRGELEYVETNV
ncbi:type II secretion system protein E [Caldicellulosiruptor saccharolyticus DSM 8903]|uniref:Type II secretion system protein E n=1 Tax=Caldicellulosiruptor saccharolyticus (strain ATCC 43494 / DSM 8903 / Tp8T 6331) TaxID=351627 RepID=A4XMS2_CALS8|nr:ATPase, T2SS/T4P/T4SS family [Caldicellulosiruptor saccharolyticus]ABP68207.1 type II secretion system protein E [Caldicellulosiruptor saccharolyticus DSM 8903]